MRRRLSKYFRASTIRQVVYIPSIILTLKNWVTFLTVYAGFRDAPGTYILRNGIRISTREGAESENIAVTFVKKEYGEVKDGSVVIDIGASIGDFSLLAALTSRNSRVYAFEPMPSTFRTLVENIRMNNADRLISPFMKAVAGRTDSRVLFQGPTSLGHSLYSQAWSKGASGGVPTECISLKDVFDDNGIDCCDLLKIDCEGAEYEILYNTPAEYLRRVKEIRLEYHHIHPGEENTIERLVEYLRAHSFTGAESARFVRNGVIWLKNGHYAA